MLEHTTTTMAMEDLESYHKALDKALMSYHRMKIKEINEFIRELWDQTYRGGDITAIEIRSDLDDDIAEARGKARAAKGKSKVRLRYKVYQMEDGFLRCTIRVTTDTVVHFRPQLQARQEREGGALTTIASS